MGRKVMSQVRSVGEAFAEGESDDGMVGSRRRVSEGIMS